jgi:thymidylate synthase (FAD)
MEKLRNDILNQKIEVLGNGFVELCDYMGNDETVVRCARQSYGKDEDALTEEMISNQIGRMMRDGHTSPFEQVVFQFHLKMPIFVARQWVRFRTARLNELSGRYTKFGEGDFYVPGKGSLRNRNSYLNELLEKPSEEQDEQSESFKESLDKYLVQTLTEEKEGILTDTVKEWNKLSYELYDKSSGKIPKELARITLPLTLMTEMYWQMDLHNLLHFLELRMEEHAQKEIREYALAIYKIVNKICPISIKHFTEYKFNALTLSESEIKALSDFLRNDRSHYRSLNDEVHIIGKIYDTADKIEWRNQILKPLVE